jgi:hypothetical protein
MDQERRDANAQFECARLRRRRERLTTSTKCAHWDSSPESPLPTDSIDPSNAFGTDPEPPTVAIRGVTRRTKGRGAAIGARRYAWLMEAMREAVIVERGACA